MKFQGRRQGGNKNIIGHKGNNKYMIESQSSVMKILFFSLGNKINKGGLKEMDI